MRLDELPLAKLRGYVEQRPINSACVFGSFADGDADVQSDLDLLVELDHTTPIGWDFFGWADELEAMLQRKVDLVTPDGLSRHIRNTVVAGVQYKA